MTANLKITSDISNNILKILFSILLSIYSIHLHGQIDPKQEMRKRFYDVAISGNHLFIAAELGLIIMDIQKGPRLLGEFEAKGSANSVTLYQDTAYLCVGPLGLYILDVKDPSRPQIRDFFDTKGSAMHVAISGNMIFVADGSLGTAILDYPKQGEIREIGRLRTQGYSRAVSFLRPYLVTAEDRDGLKVWDLRDMSKPLGHLKPQGQIRHILVSNDLVYAAGGSAGIYIVHITKEGKPEIRSHIKTFDFARGVDLLDQITLLVADGAGGLTVIDISDVYSPKPISRLATKECSYNRLRSFNGYAYVAADYQGLVIINLKNKYAPQFVTMGRSPQ